MFILRRSSPLTNEPYCKVLPLNNFNATGLQTFLSKWNENM